MAFRQDHEAAIARADALDKELEAEREKSELARVELEAERAERKRLATLVEKHELENPIAHKPAAVDPSLLRRVVVRLLIAIGIVLFVVGLVQSVYSLVKHA